MGATLLRDGVKNRAHWKRSIQLYARRREEKDNLNTRINGKGGKKAKHLKTCSEQTDTRRVQAKKEHGPGVRFFYGRATIGQCPDKGKAMDRMTEESDASVVRREENPRREGRRSGTCSSEKACYYQI